MTQFLRSRTRLYVTVPVDWLVDSLTEPIHGPWEAAQEHFVEPDSRLETNSRRAPRTNPLDLARRATRPMSAGPVADL